MEIRLLLVPLLFLNKQKNTLLKIPMGCSTFKNSAFHWKCILHVATELNPNLQGWNTDLIWNGIKNLMFSPNFCYELGSCHRQMLDGRVALPCYLSLWHKQGKQKTTVGPSVPSRTTGLLLRGFFLGHWPLLTLAVSQLNPGPLPDIRQCSSQNSRRRKV